MSASIPEILTALKDQFANLDAQIYDFVPDAPNTPCVIAYMESWPYDITAGATFVLWCISDSIEMQGAQSKLMDWLSDTGDQSLIAMLDADRKLGGVISSVCPIEVRNWRVAPIHEGGLRYVQAELVIDVLR